LKKNIKWIKATVAANVSVSIAIKFMDESGLGVILVADGQKKLLGIMTDGDVRRLIIEQKNLKLPVADYMNKDPITVSDKTSTDEMARIIHNMEISHLPVINDKGILIDLVTAHSVKNTELSNPVLIMAGGLGKRMKELTENCPKPMLKLGSKPMLEHLINNLINEGFRKFYISTCYLSHIIKDYFGDGKHWNISITYLEETEPLGTAGAINLLPVDEIKVPFLLINADIITTCSFKDLINTHTSEQALITLTVRSETFTMPFGKVQIDKNRVMGIIEKPSSMYFVNAGIYMVDPSLINNKTPAKHCDMPDLINTTISKGGNVAHFQSKGIWKDLGHIDDYEKAKGLF